MRRVIRLGDPTSHGGVVVQAASNYAMDGIPVARMGDPCTCPIRGHSGCVVAEGDPGWTIGGIPVALEGHLTSYGAALISTFGRLSRSYESSGTVQGAASPVTSSSHHSQQASSQSGDHAQFDDHYIIRCAANGEVLKYVEYAIQRADGSVEHGTTDEQGYTHLLSSVVEQEHVTVYIEG